MNPLKALVNIRSVTKELAISESLAEPGLDIKPDVPLMRFGHFDAEGSPGEEAIYWRFGARALQEMLTYTGFAASRVMEPFALHGFPTAATAPVDAFTPETGDAEPPDQRHTRRMARVRDAVGPTLPRTPILGAAWAARRRRRRNSRPAG